MRSNRKIKNPIRDQKGIALIATLMMLVLALGVVAIMFGLATQETKLTRLEQSYTTTLDAAKGGADVFIAMVQRNDFSPPQPGNNGGKVNAFGTSTNGNCLTYKLSNLTSQWAGSGNCPATASTTDPTASPDITLTLNSGLGSNSGAVPCTVNVKVIDTSKIVGQSQTGQPCYYGCYYYTVISRAWPTAGSSQYAEVFFVYRYDMPP
jgi:Tfp pilus assembly protein PilX